MPMPQAVAADSDPDGADWREGRLADALLQARAHPEWAHEGGDDKDDAERSLAE